MKYNNKESFFLFYKVKDCLKEALDFWELSGKQVSNDYESQIIDFEDYQHQVNETNHVQFATAMVNKPKLAQERRKHSATEVAYIFNTYLGTEMGITSKQKGSFVGTEDIKEMKPKGTEFDCASPVKLNEGIEKFIDEVCITLKNLKADCESPKSNVTLFQQPMVNSRKEEKAGFNVALISKSMSNWNGFDVTEKLNEDNQFSDAESNGSDKENLQAENGKVQLLNVDPASLVWDNNGFQSVVSKPFLFSTLYSGIVLASNEVMAPEMSFSRNNSNNVEQEVTPFANDSLSSTASTPINDEELLADNQARFKSTGDVENIDDLDNDQALLQFHSKFDQNLAEKWNDCKGDDPIEGNVPPQNCVNFMVNFDIWGTQGNLQSYSTNFEHTPTLEIESVASMVDIDGVSNSIYSPLGYISVNEYSSTDNSEPELDSEQERFTPINNIWRGNDSNVYSLWPEKDTASICSQVEALVDGNKDDDDDDDDNIGPAFVHYENSKFKPVIPKKIEQAQSRLLEGDASVSNVGSYEEEEEEEENLLISQRTHFVPIQSKTQNSKDDHSSAPEQPNEPVKASAEVDKNHSKPKVSVRKKLFKEQPQLSIAEIENSVDDVYLLDDENHGELLKSVFTGKSVRVLEEKSTNTDPPKLLIEHLLLQPIKELQSEEALLDKSDSIGLRHIWGDDASNSIDNGLSLPFPKVQWSTSDGADEIEEMSDYHHLSLDELIGPQAFISKDSNNNETSDSLSSFSPTEKKTENAATFKNDEKTQFESELLEFSNTNVENDSLDNQPGLDLNVLARKQGNYAFEMPTLPENVLYSSDLEKKFWEEPQDLRNPTIGEDWHSSLYRRPCSFYLEGNCRRSDCKFSHDLSSITCRFWEEGSCFKGITCPFLHGYSSNKDITPLPFSPILEDSIEPISSPLPPKWNFKLESEKDFPSLSASSLQDSDTHSNLLPLSSKDDTKKTSRKDSAFGRIIRPKKSKKSFSNHLPISSSRNDVSNGKNQDTTYKKNTSLNNRNDLSLKA